MYIFIDIANMIDTLLIFLKTNIKKSLKRSGILTLPIFILILFTKWEIFVPFFLLSSKNFDHFLHDSLLELNFKVFYSFFFLLLKLKVCSCSFCKKPYFLVLLPTESKKANLLCACPFKRRPAMITSKL